MPPWLAPLVVGIALAILLFLALYLLYQAASGSLGSRGTTGSSGGSSGSSGGAASPDARKAEFYKLFAETLSDIDDRSNPSHDECQEINRLLAMLGNDADLEADISTKLQSYLDQIKEACGGE